MGSETDGTELDCTNGHLDDEALKEVPITDDLVAIDLTANRLKRVDSRIARLTGLQTLSLRQNLLQDAAAVGDLCCAPVLEQLVLHDNQLKELPPLSKFSALRLLEVSYNSIKSLERMQDLPTASLEQFYAACNRIQRIKDLAHLSNLTSLELGGNRISDLEGLDSLYQLEELWLGRNRIEAISSLGSLTTLKRLSLQSNRLTSMAGLERCTALQELYLSHNGLKSLQGLEQLDQLTVVDVANNQIDSMQSMANLSNLTDLWLNDNQLASLTWLEDIPKNSMTCLYLYSNPVVEKLGGSYRTEMKNLIPDLKQLDADLL